MVINDPSLCNIPFLDFPQQVQQLYDAGIRFFHLDIADGHYAGRGREFAEGWANSRDSSAQSLSHGSAVTAPFTQGSLSTAYRPSSSSERGAVSEAD